MIDEDFRTLLTNLLPTSAVVEKSKISSEDGTTRTYFERADANQDTFANADEDPGNVSVFNIEVASLDEPSMQTAVEQLRSGNGSLTTLSSGINNSTTSVSVASANNLPANGLPYVITVDSEQMSVTSISGTTLTVTRGYRSTTAASHSSGAAVKSPGLNGYQGTVGGTIFLGVFTQDQSDQYEPKLLDEDEGYFVGSFQAQVFSTQQ